MGIYSLDPQITNNTPIVIISGFFWGEGGGGVFVPFFLSVGFVWRGFCSEGFVLYLHTAHITLQLRLKYFISGIKLPISSVISILFNFWWHTISTYNGIVYRAQLMAQ